VSIPHLIRSPARHAFTALLIVFFLNVAGYGQTPRLRLKFDGDLTDASGAGVITAINPSAGWTPTYVADRFGVANKAINFTGSQSLQLVADSLPGNSNQALGLRNAAGTNTSFTMTAWVKLPAFTGYNIIFGNLGGTLSTTFHAGYYNFLGKTYFGFDSSTDTISQNSLSVTNVWYHLAFVYDAATGRQRIYMNGVPDVSRACANTIKMADLFLGNAGTATDAANDFRGALDDVVIYNTALSLLQVQALYNDVDPNNPPANYIAPKLPGVIGAPGTWGVREVRGYTPASFGLASIVEADRIIKAFATTPGGATASAQYASSVINFVDPNAPGNLGSFGGETNFGTNTAGDDNTFLVLAKCTVHISTESDYTFGFIGDEGSRLRIVGQTFLSSASVNGAASNPVPPAHQGDAIYWSGATTNSGTVGVVHLAPGDYPLELTYWENTGGASIEVFAAPGAKSSIDNTFHLIGDTAAGGLPLVRDPDTVPTFTVNGGSTLFVNGGVPATFTLAWSTTNPTTTLSIDHGVGAVSQSGSTNLPSPATTTIYTITATTPIQGGNDVATKTVTVYVDAPPAVSITANDTTVLSGANVTLNWVVDGATSLTLNPGNINVFGQTSRVVNPTATTTYTLTAGNSTGSTDQSVTVTVGVPPPINSFVVADPNPLYGAETSLNWNVSNATSLSIDQNIGPVPGPTGSVSIAPLQSTTYTLTAINDFGTATATATVNQPTPIGVTNAGFTARRVFAKTTTPFPFASVTPTSYLQSAITLLGEAPGGPHYGSAEATVGNYSTVNFGDVVDGEFGGSVSFPGNNSNSANYAVRITATLVVNTPGRYSFVVSSAFGCRLRVDGQDIIYDDGSHAPGNSTGTIELSKPTVALELITYGSNGNCEVELAWIRPNLQWTLLGTITPATPAVRGQVLISEFMADNASTLADEDGIDEDWIEIWNSTNATVNLGTYFLTDVAAMPNKWQLPSWTLGANEYLVIFASEKDRTPAQAIPGKDNPGTVAQPHLHTNFKLSKTGGYLALKQANGMGGFNDISVFAAYPSQKEDVSYGSSDAEGYIGYMEVATPGSVNATTVLDFVSDTDFSHHRGRYSAPFNLTISSTTPGTTIRYTKDGSIPSLSHGTVYTGPIPISATTVIRAAAFKPGWKASNVDTETYLFIDDVVTQNTLTAVALGFPIGPVNSQAFEYGMNLGNVTAPGAGQGTLTDLKNALMAVPTVCMTTDIANLVNPATGIYVHPGEHGLFWERPVSLEYINTAGTSEFQIDCGARIRGGFSRDPSNPKHAFHLFFRGSLYEGNLKYPLFGNSGATQFDQIDMRCEENYSWSFGNDGRNTLMREEWGRVSQGDTGQPWARTGYFHLYINGIYWGIYNWEERTEASYGETYLGGIKENFDVVKSAGNTANYTTEMTDGNFAAWQTLNTLCILLKNDATETGRTAKYMQMRGLNPDGTPNAAFPVLLDVDNLIDYELVIFYDGSYDAPMSTFLNNASNNWFGVRDRTGTRGFAFFIHDNEHGMDTDVQGYNRVGPWGGSGPNNWGQGQYNTREAFDRSNPHYLHEFLCYSAEYRQRCADRAQKQFFNDGAMTTTAALARINGLAAQVDPIIHAEAARWGSATLNKSSWLNAKNVVINFINNGGNSQGGQTVFAVQPRASMILTQLKAYHDPVAVAKPLATTLIAPTFSGQFGGPVGNPYSFTITNPNGATGALYYTVNGVDPRDIGGAVHAGLSPVASGSTVMLTGTSTVRARVYNSTNLTWSALTEAQYSVGLLASASNLVISKIHYNPPGAGNLTQFVEVMNIAAENIDVSGVHFDIGIQFTFPTSPLLAPGGRLLIVRSLADFNTAYPSVPAAQIAGVFANGTALNTGGEQLQLLAASDATIRNFSYNNKDPWPESPDGSGPCLVLMRPTTNPDHSLGTNWRASNTAGGTPGTDDALSYNTWATNNNIFDPSADDDSDGLANVAEYGLGSNPHLSSSAALPIAGLEDVSVNNVVSSYLTLTFTRVIGHDDVSYAVEASSGLGSWVPAVNVGSPNFNGNGTETLTYRYPDPKTTDSKQFLRLRVTKLP
jgi:hypothetical protein